MKFIEEFKKFALKGNVVDMAVGVIIGGAFGKIVTSLVNDIIMPLITLLTGKVNLSELSLVLKETPAVNEAGETITEKLLLPYGAFIQNIIDFLIIALCIFFMVKAITKLHKKKEEAPAPAPAPSNEEVLLTEIRDLLKEKN